MTAATDFEIAELAKRFGLSHGTTTDILNHLEGEGWAPPGTYERSERGSMSSDNDPSFVDVTQQNLEPVMDLEPSLLYRIIYEIPGVHRKPHTMTAVFIDKTDDELYFHGGAEFGTTTLKWEWVKTIYLSSGHVAHDRIDRGYALPSDVRPVHPRRPS